MKIAQIQGNSAATLKITLFNGGDSDNIDNNDDERVFTDPDRLDLRRAPNPHVSFGGGPHVCLGAHFARMQLAVFYEEFLAAVPRPRLAGPPARLVSHVINSLKSLPLRMVD